MTDSALTAEGFTFGQDEQIPASGPWELVTASERRPNDQRPRSFLLQAGLTLMLAVSPVTFGHDPWLTDRCQQATLTLGSTFEAIVGRRISIQKARRIALEILSRAEQERARYAEEESRRGINWEHDQ